MNEIEEMVVKFVRRTFNFAVGHSPACLRYFVGSRRFGLAWFIIDDVVVERSVEVQVDKEKLGIFAGSSPIKTFTCHFEITGPDFLALLAVRYTKIWDQDFKGYEIKDFTVEAIAFDGNEESAFNWFTYTILMDQGS